MTNKATTKRDFSETTRALVEDEIRAAVDRAVTELGVSPEVVLEILQGVTRGEEQFQRDLR